MHFPISARDAAALFGAVSLVALAAPIEARTIIPKDVERTCTVAEDTFEDWFGQGQPTRNGRVTPADSVDFPTQNTVCDFYKWATRMFLWLTSPRGDGFVLDGPAIFTVLPANDQGNRHLIKHTDDTLLRMALRSRKFDDIEEIAQAGGRGVLMSQGGSLVYYGVHVNDVYGYFLTGQKRGAFPKVKQYPHNLSALKAVKAYVRKAFPETTLRSPETLIMELKTSWVEASTLSHPEAFVRIQAKVPKYTRKSRTHWQRNGTKTAELALTGIHIVGTVQNHPELVWASFEHVRNAPNNRYWYRDREGNLTKRPYSAQGDYLFMERGGSKGSANTECMHENPQGDIVVTKSSGQPNCAGGIVASNTVRTHPWGRAPDKASAKNNTRLLSNNLSVHSQLAEGDVRKNYIQIGGIWTSPPKPSAEAPIPGASGFKPSDVRGSLTLANATMETYHQHIDCFTCHSHRKQHDHFFDLSHIFSAIVPLPQP